MLGPDGKPRQFTRQHYRDSEGRDKEIVQRALGDQKWVVEKHGFDGEVSKNLHGLTEGELPEFEAAWKGEGESPASPIEQEADAAKVWDPQWEAVVNDLEGIGFSSDREQVTQAVKQAEGDLKGAMRILLAAERNEASWYTDYCSRDIPY
eukprot:TRINITY_DN582_c0_g1_i2.p2 TRINITY_DN582_c0_g1~~TRINITY_DN582_c0_g1_i2.p2  ORF type:complete len:150 (+),score=42.26 TRINITY_DN582_c0_g1_i2:480-929(+)